MCFLSKRAKIERMVLNIFEKYAKIRHFLQFSEDFFCKFSKVVRRSGGSALRTPYEADPFKMSPPRTEILQAPMVSNFQLSQLRSASALSKRFRAMQTEKSGQRNNILEVGRSPRIMLIVFLTPCNPGQILTPNCYF